MTTGKPFILIFAIASFTGCKNHSNSISDNHQKVSMSDSIIEINFLIGEESFLIDSIINTPSFQKSTNENTFITKIYFTKDFNRKEEGNLFYYELEYPRNVGKYCFSELGSDVVPRAYFYAYTKYNRTATHEIDKTCSKEWIEVVVIDPLKETVSFELLTHYNRNPSSPREIVHLKIKHLPFSCVVK